jgi:hypothetical protein
MKVEKVFNIPLSACTGPMGMAIGPENQILLGCSANGNQNSAIIDKNSGKVESILTGYGGTDEVSFNTGSGHYILPHCVAGCRTDPATAPEEIAVVDSERFRNDTSVTVASPPSTTATGPAGPSVTQRKVKSIVVDPKTNKAYIPIPGIGGSAPIFAPTICSSAPTKVGSPTNATGCIAVFKDSSED